jgi:hypothetical protein
LNCWSVSALGESRENGVGANRVQNLEDGGARMRSR